MGMCFLCKKIRRWLSKWEIWDNWKIWSFDWISRWWPITKSFDNTREKC